MADDTFLLAGFPVHRVGFGAMQLPGPGVMGPPRDHDAAIAVLRRAVELGVNHIDTAQFYGPSVANELIREALHPYPDNLVLVSKLGAERDAEGNWISAQEPAQLRADLEANLRTLGVDHLGAVNLRLHDGGSNVGDGAAEDGSSGSQHQQVRFEDQLAEMAKLRDEGKIVGVGISTAGLDQVRTAHETVGLVCVQNAYSLVDRSDQPVLDYCTEHEIAYVPYFPLGSAIPGMAKVAEQPAVVEIAERLGVSGAQVGLAWLLAKAPNVLLIPGTSSVDHLEQNLACADVQLTDEDRQQLEQSAG